MAVEVIRRSRLQSEVDGFLHRPGHRAGRDVSDIKRAYKRLARRFHPDINPGDRMAAAQFRQIAEAYETLSDPDRRRHYDTAGSTSAGEPAVYGFEGFDFSVSVGGESAPTFGDLFAEVIGQREAQRHDGAPARGADLHQAIGLTLRRGGSRRPACPRRHAPGTLPQLQGSRSLARRGEPVRAVSWVRRVEVGARAHGVLEAVRDVRRHRTSAADAVPGVRRAAGRNPDRSTDRQRAGGPGRRRAHPRAGKGHVGRSGGENGDLYISVQVQPHPLFRREGDDLHLVVPVAIHEAALGAKIEVPSLDGPARVRIPPGTQSGQRFRLHERGVPSSRRWPSRRSRGRSEARAAEAARRAIEGTAEGIRQDQRWGPAESVKRKAES